MVTTSLTWPLLLFFFIFIFITREAVVICQHESHNQNHVRIRRLIGPAAATGSATASASSLTVTVTAPEESNYYHHQQRPVDYEDSSSSADDDDDDDNEGDLSSQEIRELVEQNLVPAGKGGAGAGAAAAAAKRKHRGPPPFESTLQGSSQEEFIVRNDASGGVDGKDKVILVPSSVSGKKGDKRKNGKSGGNYFTNKAQHHHEIFGLDGRPVSVSRGAKPSHQPKTQCVCDTRDCVSNENEMDGQPTICFTHGMCYTQYLERVDGTNSVTKGCISGETPLLCENRRPSSSLLRNKRWPYLVCCKSHLCNAGNVLTTTWRPTVKTLMTDQANSTYIFDSDDDATSDEALPNSTNGTLVTNVTNSEQSAGGSQIPTRSRTDNEIGNRNMSEILASSSTPSKSTRFISPLASAFLIGGAIIIVLVSAIGFWILRMEQRRLARRYYQKTETDADPEHQQPQIQDNEHENIEEIHVYVPSDRNSENGPKTKPLLPKKFKSKKNAKARDENGHYKLPDNADHHQSPPQSCGNELNSNLTISPTSSSSIPASSLSLLSVPVASHSSSHQHHSSSGNGQAAAAASTGSRKTTIL